MRAKKSARHVAMALLTRWRAMSCVTGRVAPPGAGFCRLFRPARWHVMAFSGSTISLLRFWFSLALVACHVVLLLFGEISFRLVE